VVSSRTINNPLALAVLAYLLERPMHPYELGKLLKERSLHEAINYKHSSLYSVVEQLRRAGYITEHQTVRDTRRPERTVYTLTDTGRAELADWMRTLVSTPAREYRQFAAALALIVVLPPAEVVGLLTQRHQALREQADGIRAALQANHEHDTDPVFFVEDEYQLTIVEAELAFIERLRTRITSDDDPAFGRFWRHFHSRPADQRQDTGG
jgi:DNA-binding PadR family transcriptional regulator